MLPIDRLKHRFYRLYYLPCAPAARLTLVLMRSDCFSARVIFTYNNTASPATRFSFTQGNISDSKDVARNVERSEHLEDPVQKRIYDAETVKIAPLKEAHADQVAQHEKDAAEGGPHGQVLGTYCCTTCVVHCDAAEAACRRMCAGGIPIVMLLHDTVSVSRPSCAYLTTHLCIITRIKNTNHIFYHAPGQHKPYSGAKPHGKPPGPGHLPAAPVAGDRFSAVKGAFGQKGTGAQGDELDDSVKAAVAAVLAPETEHQPHAASRAGGAAATRCDDGGGKTVDGVGSGGGGSFSRGGDGDDKSSSPAAAAASGGGGGGGWAAQAKRLASSVVRNVGASFSAKAKEPTGKEVKEQSTLLVIEDPATHRPHVAGTHDTQPYLPYCVVEPLLPAAYKTSADRSAVCCCAQVLPRRESSYICATGRPSYICVSVTPSTIAPVCTNVLVLRHRLRRRRQHAS